MYSIERVSIQQWQLVHHLNADERRLPYSHNTCNRNITGVERCAVRRSLSNDAYGSAA